MRLSDAPLIPATRDQIRAMAHPLRLRMYELLREGPSTATRLASELGESSGSTSYHLRILARAGLIEEDTEQGNARDRWWRRRLRVFIPTDAEDPETQALEAEARLVHLRRDEEALRRFTQHVGDLTTEWRRAAFTGSFNLWLTAEETLAIGMEMLAKVEQMRRAPPERPPGARRVLVTFRALPWIEEQGEADSTPAPPA